jgi:hypothetical protein
MAQLWITEYEDMAIAGGFVPAGQEPAVTTQNVTFTTATQSAAFKNSTRFIRVVASAACHLAFGTNPTATTDTTRLAAGAAEYFGVKGGHKVSAVTGS